MEPEQQHARTDAATRSEEELRTEAVPAAPGSVHVRTTVEAHDVGEDVPRRVERVGDLERVDPGDEDSGEIEVLDDGSVSIPVLEEQLVVSRRVIVRERVIVRKVTETEVERIRAQLRRERISIVADDPDSVEIVDD
jgi:uncharacterized protein (TIGR02271 family)